MSWQSVVDSINRIAENAGARRAPEDVDPTLGMEPEVFLRHHGYDDREAGNFWPLVAYMRHGREHGARRGLAIFGNPGIGKSMGLMLAGRYLGRCTTMTARDLVERFEAGTNSREKRGSWGNVDGWYSDVLLDDCGDECKGNEKGPDSHLERERRDTVAAFVRRRYRIWKGGHRRLMHLTCNFLPEEFASIYDPRTADRLQEICQWPPLIFGGDSRRKVTDDLDRELFELNTGERLTDEGDRRGER